MLRNFNSFSSISDFLVYVLEMLLAMLISITFHEYAHAAVANRLGDPTAKNMGRLSLDPLRHVDPIGLLSFVLFGWGWAKPVMINSRNLKNPRRDDLLISIAGPAANLVLGFVFYITYFASIMLGMQNDILLNILATTCTMNISFAIFNLIPIHPLDGFHVLTSIFPKLGYKFLAFMRQYGMWILVALSYSGILDQILTPVAMAIYNFFNAILMLFV